MTRTELHASTQQDLLDGRERETLPVVTLRRACGDVLGRVYNLAMLHYVLGDASFATIEAETMPDVWQHVSLDHIASYDLAY